MDSWVWPSGWGFLAHSRGKWCDKEGEGAEIQVDADTFNLWEVIFIWGGCVVIAADAVLPASSPNQNLWTQMTIWWLSWQGWTLETTIDCFSAEGHLHILVQHPFTSKSESLVASIDYCYSVPTRVCTQLWISLITLNTVTKWQFWRDKKFIKYIRMFNMILVDF